MSTPNQGRPPELTFCRLPYRLPAIDPCSRAFVCLDFPEAFPLALSDGLIAWQQACGRRTGCLLLEVVGTRTWTVVLRGDAGMGSLRPSLFPQSCWLRAWWPPLDCSKPIPRSGVLPRGSRGFWSGTFARLSFTFFVCAP